MGKIEIDTGSKGGGMMSFGEKRHLFMMIAALAVLLSIMLNPDCGRPGKETPAREKPVDPEKKLEETAPDYTDPALGELKGGVQMGETKIKKEKPHLLEKCEKGMVVGDPEIWKRAKPDGSISMDALSQAIEVTIDIRDDELEKVATDSSIECVFADDNQAQRGKFFSIRGTVEDMKGTYVTLTRSAARKLPLASFVYEGIITDEKTGKKIIVYGADICEEYIIKRKIDFKAVFAGMKKDWTEDKLVPLFVFKTCTRVYRDPLAGVTEFKPGMKLGDPEVWAMSEDLMKDVIEKEPYYHALDILVNISQADLEACVDPELNFSRIFRKTLNPAQHRGKVYKLRGRVLRIEEKKASPRRAVTKKLPHSPYVFVGQIREEESMKPFTFRALNIPPDLKEGDFVELCGIYVKVYTFPNRMGEGNYTRTPLIMGKTVIRFKRKAYIMESVSIISSILFLFLLWAALSERKRTREFDKRMRELKERKRKRQGPDEQGKDEGERDKEVNVEVNVNVNQNNASGEETEKKDDPDKQDPEKSDDTEQSEEKDSSENNKESETGSSDKEKESD